MSQLLREALLDIRDSSTTVAGSLDKPHVFTPANITKGIHGEIEDTGDDIDVDVDVDEDEESDGRDLNDKEIIDVDAESDIDVHGSVGEDAEDVTTSSGDSHPSHSSVKVANTIANLTTATANSVDTNEHVNQQKNDGAPVLPPRHRLAFHKFQAYEKLERDVYTKYVHENGTILEQHLPLRHRRGVKQYLIHPDSDVSGTHLKSVERDQNTVERRAALVEANMLVDGSGKGRKFAPLPRRHVKKAVLPPSSIVTRSRAANTTTATKPKGDAIDKAVGSSSTARPAVRFNGEKEVVSSVGSKRNKTKKVDKQPEVEESISAVLPRTQKQTQTGKSKGTEKGKAKPEKVQENSEIDAGKIRIKIKGGRIQKADEAGGARASKDDEKDNEPAQTPEQDGPVGEKESQNAEAGDGADKENRSAVRVQEGSAKEAVRKSGRLLAKKSVVGNDKVGENRSSTR